MTGSLPATRRATRWCSKPRGRSAVLRSRTSSAPGRRSGAARRPPCRAGVSARRRALSRPAICAEAVAETLRRPRGDDPPARRRDGADRLRRGDRAAGRVDRLGRPASRDDARAPGVVACDARHLGALERLPDLPCVAPAADIARHDRRAGGWRYKSPHPKPAPPGPKPAGKPDQVVAGKPLPGIPLGYPMPPARN